MVMRQECGQGDPVVRGDDRRQAPVGAGGAQEEDPARRYRGRGQPGDARAYQNVVLSFSVFTSNLCISMMQAYIFVCLYGSVLKIFQFVLKIFPLR